MHTAYNSQLFKQYSGKANVEIGGEPVQCPAYILLKATVANFQEDRRLEPRQPQQLFGKSTRHALYTLEDTFQKFPDRFEAFATIKIAFLIHVVRGRLEHLLL